MKDIFHLKSDYKPLGDQPEAIKNLTQGFQNNEKHQTLLGATGTGKTFTMANVINNIEKPTLIIAHNKTLAAQLASEFKGFFPDAAVHYFVSYYDYYQPEAYIASTDTFIEKDALVNEEIEKLRHAATQDLLTRKDVIIVASVSCIYGIGEKESYEEMSFSLKQGEEIPRQSLLKRLIQMQYSRAGSDLKAGMFDVMGDVVEILPPSSSLAYQLTFWDNEIEAIHCIDPFTGDIKEKNLPEILLFPAKHYAVHPDTVQQAIPNIQKDLDERHQELKDQGKIVEAQRLHARVTHDVEMLRETSFTNGMENYSWYFSNRKKGSPPMTLIDYFPSDSLMFIDESHITVSQIGAMHGGDRSRKENLVSHGFRLPSALDNRPLKFTEFEKRIRQVCYVSATPKEYELQKSNGVSAEQIIRPTGLLDPNVEIRKTEHCIDDILNEIKKSIAKKERVFITTLTKKSSEELSEFLIEEGIRVTYLHSDITTFERVEILHKLRNGTLDALVGINLLREGLDIPEVALVMILDADKQGFLRSTTSLIQTIGRAARNASGRVILYADVITKSIKEAMDETSRRRAKQIAYNTKHGITPQTIIKSLDMENIIPPSRRKSKKKDKAPKRKEDIQKEIISLEVEMDTCAGDMNFEKAAELRDEIMLLQEILEKDTKK
jgi:excinuclease ABC subunit B